MTWTRHAFIHAVGDDELCAEYKQCRVCGEPDPVNGYCVREVCMNSEKNQKLIQELKTIEV